MTAKWGRKSVILFYASVRGLLTLKRLIIEINRLVKRAFDVAGRESSRVVETAVGTRTYSKDARRIVPSNGHLMWLR